jgi:hypothetical protein
MDEPAARSPIPQEGQDTKYRRSDEAADDADPDWSQRQHHLLATTRGGA